MFLIVNVKREISNETPSTQNNVIVSLFVYSFSGIVMAECGGIHLGDGRDLWSAQKQRKTQFSNLSDFGRVPLLDYGSQTLAENISGMWNGVATQPSTTAGSPEQSAEAILFTGKNSSDTKTKPYKQTKNTIETTL